LRPLRERAGPGGRRERKTLDRVLSRAGAMSRKQAEEAIRAGRVRVNNLRVLDPAAWVDLSQDRVMLDDKPLRESEPLYLALHKPVGLVTTRSDERGRDTIYTLLGDVEPWVAPVGRLDRETSGLLLLTNDTDWAERVTNPLSGIAKRYLCRVEGELSDEQIGRLRLGLEIEDGPTRPAQVRRIGEGRIELEITEGRNRQVRRMLEAVGSRVVELQRASIGPVELGALPPGRWRVLTSREVRDLRRS
jgi:23S rRNA pseudouridine2605 synthase